MSKNDSDGSISDLIRIAGDLPGTNDDWQFDDVENSHTQDGKLSGSVSWIFGASILPLLVLCALVNVDSKKTLKTQLAISSKHEHRESSWRKLEEQRAKSEQEQLLFEAIQLGKMLPDLIERSALNFESPQKLKENALELSMQFAKIPQRTGTNRELFSSVGEMIEIQAIMSRQANLLDSIDRLNRVLARVDRGDPKCGEFTRDVYIVTQMGKSFFELEYGIDQANYERTTHVMNAIIGCISALEQLNPERLRRLERETGLDFLAYRQKLVEFRSLKDYRVDAEELTGKLIDKDAAIVIEARLLATLAIAFHKFNLDDPIVGELTVYRDAVWRNLFGNFELLDGGVVAEFPEVTQKKSHAFICRALNDLAMGVKNSVDHDVKEVEAIYRRILKSTDQAGFYSRALTLSHRGDLYLSNQQILEINGDSDQELLQQYQANELSDRESAINLLTKNFDEDTDAIGPRRILRKNYYRLGLAYFKQGDTDLALYHVGNGSFGPWQFIEKNGAVTEQLCEDVQLSAVEKFKVCAITLLTKHTYKDDFLKRRLDELVRQTAGSFAEYEERESQKSKEAGDRASRYVTYWLNDMMATMGKVKQDYDGDLLDGPLELVRQKLDERKGK